MAMRGPWTAIAVALLVAGPACSSSGSPADGGADGPPAGTCQAIRICALDCADDACVTNNCVPRGSAAAQAAFQSLFDCTKAAQPTGGGCATPNDVECLCLAQCLQDPPCYDLAMECAGGTDNVCDVTCH
jgi:hypothetical protein